MGIFLDTTVLIDVLRGRPAADRLRSLRATEEAPYTCAINVEELVRGVRAKEIQALDGFLEGLRIVPLGMSEGHRAGRWRREAAGNGITLSQADCLIAAAAVTVAARLATGNPKDFPQPELIVEHWPVGR